MEETGKKEHRLTVSERGRGTLTGVLDVYSFDETQIQMATSQGGLIIRGKELHVSRLQLEKGEVDVEGHIDSLVYSDAGQKKQKEGPLLARLFR